MICMIPPWARSLQRRMKVYLVFEERLAPVNIQQVPVVIDLYHCVLEVLHPHRGFHHIGVLLRYSYFFWGPM